MRNAATAISAHGSFHAICIKIPHGEIVVFALFQDDQSICSNSKPAVTELPDQIRVLKGEFS